MTLFSLYSISIATYTIYFPKMQSIIGKWPCDGKCSFDLFLLGILQLEVIFMAKKIVNIDKTDGLWPWGPGFGQVIPDTDPFGSYTGRPIDPTERPVQDADDL